jgi:hypothetical protein
MTLLRRRSAATAAGDSAEDLAESIAVEDVYELLYRRGENDLAAAVITTLAPAEARAVAQRLRRLVRRATRCRFFRDYRTALRPKEAARLGLVALWSERASAAGCRVWADLRAEPAPLPRRTLVGAVTSEADETERARPDALAQSESARLMPEWLAAPESSVWST